MAKKYVLIKNDSNKNKGADFLRILRYSFNNILAQFHKLNFSRYCPSHSVE